jgi:glycosyltransferase involved in cell wall biosynthesis
MFAADPPHVGILGPVDLRRVSSLKIDDESLFNESFPLVGDIANGLAALGCRLTCISLSRKVAHITRFENSEKNFVAFLVPQRPKRSAFDFYRTERKRLHGVLAGLPCDLYHAHWTYEYAAAAIESGRRHLVTAHDNPLMAARWFRFTRAYPHWIARSLLGRNILSRTKAFSAVSEYLLKLLKPCLRPDCRSFLTPNGIPDTLLNFGRANSAPHSLRKSRNIVTVMNGFRNMKNGASALRGFGMFLKSNPCYYLHMFGASYEPGGEAETWAKQRGFSQNVFFHGPQNQRIVHDFISRQGWTLLHTSLDESFGMAPLEAMALGVPVVGGLVSGNIPFLLQKGKAGVLTSVTNPSAIANSLESLKNSDFYENIRREAFLAARQYSLHNCVSRYMEVYRNILASPC